MSDIDMGGPPSTEFDLPEPDFDRFGDDGSADDSGAPDADTGAPGQGQGADSGAPAPQTSFPTIEAATAEIAKVRQEAAKYRVENRDYDRDFGGMHPEDRQSIAGFVNAYRAGDNQRMLSWIVANGQLIAEQMGKPWAELALGGNGVAVPAAAAPPPITPVDLSDPANFEKAVNAAVQKHITDYDTQRQATEARNAAADHILTTMRERGYDVETPAGQHILFLIKTMNDRDVSKAIDKYESDMAEQAQSYLERKRKQAADAAGTAPAGGAPPSGEVDPERDEPDPLRRAERAMNRRLDALQRPRRAG